MIGFSSKRPNFGGICAELWTRLEQQMHAVSWTALRATTNVRENDDRRKDEAWQVHDLVLTLAEGCEVSSRKQLVLHHLEVDWLVNVSQILV